MEATLDRMRQIPLSTTATIEIVAIATFVWLADFGCLVASFGAVHATVPVYGVLLAYGVAQVVGSLPFIPGGIGIIESSLAVILIEYGAGRVSALSAALVYRIISFWLGIAVGWITIAVIARRARRSEASGQLRRPHMQTSHRPSRTRPPLDQITHQVDQPEAVTARLIGWPTAPSGQQDPGCNPCPRPGTPPRRPGAKPTAPRPGRSRARSPRPR